MRGLPLRFARCDNCLQEATQRRLLVVVEVAQDDLIDGDRHLLEPFDRPPTGRRELEDVAPAVPLVALPADEARPLQTIDEVDDVARIDADLRRHLALRQWRRCSLDHTQDAEAPASQVDIGRPALVGHAGRELLADLGGELEGQADDAAVGDGRGLTIHESEHIVGTINDTSIPSFGQSNGVRPAIVVDNLVKRYGSLTAVDGISFDVAPGEIFGFLGPNGAGKSTTIKVLCTLVDPTEGTATVAGHDVQRDRLDVRRHIGLVFQDQTLDVYLTAEQNLRFHAELYGMPKAAVASRMRDVLEMVGLWERRSNKVQTFSGGMRRRLEIARGLMHSPRVLFLDEPTVGLDPQTRASIWGYIEELRRREDITIFLTTHYMDEAENCERIAIMDAGRIVVLDTPDRLKASVGTDRVSISTDDDERAIDALRERLDITANVHDGQVTFAVADGEHFVPRLFAELGLPIKSVSVARPSLDDVFMTFTGRTIRDAEATSVDNLRVFANPGRR